MSASLWPGAVGNVALADQAQAAAKSLRADVERLATGEVRAFDPDMLPDRSAAMVFRIVARHAEGKAAFCPHLSVAAPCPVYTATWRPIVCCATCRPRILAAPQRRRCVECGTRSSRMIAVGVGSLLVALPLCGPCQGPADS